MAFYGVGHYVPGRPPGAAVPGRPPGAAGFAVPGRPFAAAGLKGTGKGGFEEEDRSRDWFCGKCRERNFVKRSTCFRCNAPRPKIGEANSELPKLMTMKPGTTLNGMVKSYNRKGFGFLMCFGVGDSPDVYYLRENLSPKLETRDIPGQHVTFELHREAGGKLLAVNIRPLGEDKASAMMPAPNAGGKAGGKGGLGGVPVAAAGAGGSLQEDRSRDWYCTVCKERNFMKRFECCKCKAPRKADQGDAPGAERHREVSPHAGSRAMASMRSRGGRSRSRSRDKKKKKKKKSKRRSRSSTSSGSSRSSSGRRKSGKKSGGRSSSSKASSIDSDSSSDCKMEDPPGSEPTTAAPEKGMDVEAHADPEVVKSKAEALEELKRLQSMEPVEKRMKEWRALLRKWHPDKNPDRVEVATAVFQFLQKGKCLLEV